MSTLSLVIAVLVAGACGFGGGTGAPASSTGWADQEVHFQAGGQTVFGTLRHPASGGRSVPAVLIIAGSGPTDRNGNSTLITGQIGTLNALAEWLSADGVASLLYDKLGTGTTGLGPYAANVAGIGISAYQQEAAAALTFLASQPGIDRKRLAVFGHSEGALYALLLATDTSTALPPVHALGLLEPLSRRALDVIGAQVMASVAAQRQAGKITAAQEAQVQATLNSAIQSLRTSGTVAANLPYGLASLLNPTVARYLSETDRYDPAQLAASLPARFPVLVSCSDADIQVSCDDVAHLVAGLGQAQAGTMLVRLAGVDHVLKEDPSRSGASYGEPLPYSTQLRSGIRSFVSAHL